MKTIEKFRNDLLGQQKEIRKITTTPTSFDKLMEIHITDCPVCDSTMDLVESVVDGFNPKVGHHNYINRHFLCECCGYDEPYYEY